jgi:hypothetical protein
LTALEPSPVKKSVGATPPPEQQNMILAYVDPGLGSLLWQTIVSAFVGFLFYLKKTRRLIVGFFRKILGGRGKKPEDRPFSGGGKNGSQN